MGVCVGGGGTVSLIVGSRSLKIMVHIIVS